MKKNLLIFLWGLACLFLLGCGTKTVPSTTIDTWALFSGEDELTWAMAMTWSSLREELTGDVVNEVKSFSWQQNNATNTGYPTGNNVIVTDGKVVSDDVKNLINQYKPKGVDKNEDYENMVDLIDKIILKVGSIGD